MRVPYDSESQNEMPGRAINRLKYIHSTGDPEAIGNPYKM